MKKVLLTSTILVMTAGYAAAEVSVGGSGRMGVIGGGNDDLGTPVVDETDLAFTSRIRISFSASGETDSGLSFGGSIRADNAGGGNAGTDGSVFVEGTFGKITMGDVSGAPEAAVGDLSGVGLTGLGDLNELTYLSNNPGLETLVDADSSARQAARWDYTTGDLGLHVSANNPRSVGDGYGIAVTYGMGDISFGLGHEDLDGVGHTVAGVTAGFGDATVKAVYGDASDIDFKQYGVSLDYVTGATTVTAFWITREDTSVGGLDDDSYGVGASYDLGGGAALKAGWVDGDSLDDATYDLGISMSF